MRSSLSRPIAGGRPHVLPLQAASRPVAVPKKDDAPIRPAINRAQGGDLPPFFTEEAMLRLEGGLRAQREQQETRRFCKPDAASSPPRDPSALRDRLSESAQIEPITKDGLLAPGGGESKIRKEETVPLSTWRWLKVDLLLCALLLVVGGTDLVVSLKARTGGSTDAAPVNFAGRGQTASAARDNDEPRQPTANTVRSSAATPSPPPSPTQPDGQRVEAQGPATPAASGTPARLDEQPVEAQRRATPASGTPARPHKHPIQAQGPAPPASGTPARPHKHPIQAQGPAPPATSGTPAPPHEHPTEAQGHATMVASGTPAPPHEHPTEAQGRATLLASESPTARPQCDIPVCQQFYRSFRPSDCTYQPFSGGPRRICER
jgi:hypothetical protein